MDMDEKLREIHVLVARMPLTLEEKSWLINLWRGLTAGGPSMCDELLEDRRRERERDREKEGCQ
jgi:hypothetical protein